MKAEIKGTTLTLTIELTEPAMAPRSKSGKTRMLATSGGFRGLGDMGGVPVSMSYNIIAK